MLYQQGMTLKRFPRILSFFSAYFSNSDPERDEQSVQAFISASTKELQSQIVSEIKLLLGEAELSLEEFGTEANRWFADISEARTWLTRIQASLESSEGPQSLAIKDSNGTLLSEGDSVIVIKDLKVKGGSSDLKRGTAIKKIHLIDDPLAIECRVDGSTLVLKTCFLKKA